MDPVIVVGAGPVGLTLALALARRDIPVVLLDEGPGPGRTRADEQRPARTAILRPDTAHMLSRLGCAAAGDAGARWTGWRTMRRRQTVRQVVFDSPWKPENGTADASLTGPSPHGEAGPGETPGVASPLHLPQHVLTRSLRAALAPYCEQTGSGLVHIASGGRLDVIEQDETGVSAHTKHVPDTAPIGDADPADESDADASAALGRADGKGIWWRGSYLIGCDGPRSTVRKLLRVRFPGRTAVERHAVAALRADLPFPGEGLLHRTPPWRGADTEVTARPLLGGAWRLDWLLPPGRDLVTPEALLSRVRDTLTGWCGSVPPYELLDTGVYLAHHRLARRWRVGRAFLAGDAAHLIGALGTQGLDEGLRDVDNLAWKLALAWHHGAADPLLDSYQAERRAAVGGRLRAADQVLPQVRAPGGWSAVRRSVLPGAVRNHDALLTDGYAGLGHLGAPPAYLRGPLAPATPPEGAVPVGTVPGAPVADVPVMTPTGLTTRLRDRLGGEFLVLLVAPGTGVWERRHWVSAGLMPRLAAAVTALPVRAELLVTESYPGAAAHTVLLVRPDGHLVAALAGVRPAELYACADAARGGLLQAPAPSPT
ncbi:FAD-dependent monooxygenase [Streptomyces zagrosensis]|uniref:3-(3-hydroxy-phenyl)propionate hydroxylase n=1 Tax=Streptomyces zagrosensis TaxID=1042984 RepID=A0A7W9QC29_9ACTN|nr:FAD-dependent monooxygenase [Streptomyces zagrosensis]MBB5937510.1 3-(3-hydroxy-phenyl)propionate hydroxylase [Streptomyces zagrosensis]